VAELAIESFEIQGEAWEVLDISRGISGRMSEVRVRVTLPLAIEDWSTEFSPADRLYVRRDPDGTPEIVAKVRALTPNISWSADDESMVATLVGPEWDLRRHTIFGQRCTEAKDADTASPEYMTGMRTLFNPDGKPNRLSALGGSGSDQYLFHPDPSDTDDTPVAWTAKTAVLYVLQSYQDWCTTELVTPVIADLSADITWPDSGGYEDEVLFHVRIHGLTVDQALTEILDRMGMGWSLVAKDAADETHTLRVFVKGDEDAAAAGDKLALWLPAHDGELPGGGAHEDEALAAGHIILDHVPVISRVRGYSGVKVYETTFQLVAGWDPADEEYAMGGPTVTDLEEKLSYLAKNMNPDTSADWDRCKWVGRRWVLNETGREVNRAESTTPYDFESLFGTRMYAKRPRPFLPHRMTLDDEGRFKDVIVWVESPIHAYQSDCEYEWELLDEVAGVYFTGPTPPIFPWRAYVTDDIDEILPDGVWAVAAVESDQCYLHEQEPSAPDLSLLVDQVLDLEGKLAWDSISGPALESDFDAYVDAKAETWMRRLDSGRVTLDKIVMDYRPGQWITSIAGRAITLHAQIVGVRWDVLRQQTHLALSTMLADLDGEPLRAEPQPEEEVLGPPAPDDYTEEYSKIIRGERAVPRRYLPDWGRERGPRKREGLNIPMGPDDRVLDRGVRRQQEDPTDTYKPQQPQAGIPESAWRRAEMLERLRRRRERSEGGL
jgi:hypothetical protein